MTKVIMLAARSVRAVFEGSLPSQKARTRRCTTRFRILTGGDPARTGLRGAVLRCGNVLHRERGVRSIAAPKCASRGGGLALEEAGAGREFSKSPQHDGSAANVSGTFGRVGTGAQASDQSGTHECISPYGVPHSLQVPRSA